MKKIFYLAILLHFGMVQSQNKGFTYTPDNMDSLENYISNVTGNKIKTFDAAQQKKAKEVLLDRKESFLKSIKDSTFIFDKKINKYLQNLLSQIYKSNSQIDHSGFYFFINKSLIPNAACYGNGIFTVNLGLLNLADSDDEIAAVICHELSHYILKHNDRALKAYLETFNSKENKQKINAAANLKYGRRAAVATIMKDLKFNFMDHSRKDEMQADSLGYVLYNKTAYNKQAYVDILKKLDFSDGMIFSAPTNLKQTFNFNDYPFKENWLLQDDKLFDTKESVNDFELNKDSLKTHPDIPLRVESIIKANKLSSTKSRTEDLALIKKRISENSIEIYLDASKLDIALYQLLSLHEKGEINDASFNEAVTSLLRKVYLFKEAHVFGKYIGQVNPFSEEKYLNEIRLFLNNIELKNIRKIGYYYCQKNETAFKDNTVFQDNFTFFKKLNQN
ncbi:M48 family metallopeptidase [Flavobacterium sp. HTF]|uniref:M48 family metallopeptidase n=1 Tax=Flavobacterium sp. HTF TaxID=2170732 RepID=UPI000D5F4700|nr:M48 family metallopeptidase [Flavobacterium sp. HTF]PWB21967.1 hypothetical protein DCO46_18460 [Flavobacterium sp. HTF]